MPDVEYHHNPMSSVLRTLSAIDALLYNINPVRDSHNIMWKSRKNLAPLDAIDFEKTYSEAFASLVKSAGNVQQQLASARADLKELQAFCDSLARQAARFSEIQMTLRTVIDQRAAPLRAELRELDKALQLCAIAKL